jgi:hypothetical protein
MNPDTQATLAEARMHVLREVFVPEFFEKLGRDHGIRPRNDAEASHLLYLGENLLAQEQQKTAAAAANNQVDELLLKASAEVYANSQRAGLPTTLPPGYRQEQFPEVYNDVELMKAGALVASLMA